MDKYILTPLCVQGIDESVPRTSWLPPIFYSTQVIKHGILGDASVSERIRGTCPAIMAAKMVATDNMNLSSFSSYCKLVAEQ